jgi:hypothetical protein
LDRQVKFSVLSGPTERERRATLRQSPREAWQSFLEQDERVGRTAQGDAELFDQLVACGFKGKLWTVAADSMARYCYAVIEAWLHTKEIFDRCAEHGFGLPRPPYPLSSQDVRDLAGHTVSMALNNFRRRSLAGTGWSPTGGASLTSWLIGDCLTAFPNVWRQWLREQNGLASREDAAEVLVAYWRDTPVNVPSAEEVAVLRAEVEEALGSASRLLKSAIELIALGYSQAEACEALGGRLTVRALEGQLHRLRRRIRKGGE